MKTVLRSRVRPIIVMFTFLFIWSTYTHSAYAQNRSAYVENSLRFSTAELGSTPQQIRHSSVRALLNYHWKIISVENNLITAENKGSNAKVRFLDDQTIEVSVSNNIKWAKNLKKGILIELKYYHYISKFDK